MAANVNPIYTKVGNINGVNFTAANVKSDGTGTIATDIYKAFTADATNGSYVSRIRLNTTATTAATATTATTLRVFISNKTSGATTGGTDTWLFAEVAAGAQTADHSTNATSFIEIPLNFVLPASYTILVSTHVVAAANTAWQAVVYGGDY
jgi:hypothetical protein